MASEVEQRPSVLGTRPWSDAATCNAPAEAAAPPLPATGGGRRLLALGAALLGAVVGLRTRTRSDVAPSQEA